MKPIITTLNDIRVHEPYASGWAKLLSSLGKTKADDEPVALTTILESNGITDAIRCLRAVEGHDREIRLFAVACARHVQHLTTDPRSHAALDVAERYATGEATSAELAVARTAAWAAARAAARDTAWDAAWDAAFAAAFAAAWAAAGGAAWDAAWAAEREWQAQKFIEIFGGNDGTDHHHS